MTTKTATATATAGTAQHGSIADEYFAAQAGPAPTICDFRAAAVNGGAELGLEENFLMDKRHNTVLAFFIRHVLSQEECEDLIQMAEISGSGMVAPDKTYGTLRTAKRTSNYQNEALSTKIAERLNETLSSKLDNSTPNDKDKLLLFGDFYGLHSNWRIVRYDKGDSFAAHQDQMDSIQLPKQDGSGGKELLYSSHTLLINLSPDGVEGGATRFYPDAKAVRGKHASRSRQQQYYQNAVDVYLPRGSAIVFQQKDLIHAGQPVTGDISKYVAQAGVLRRPYCSTTTSSSNATTNNAAMQPFVFRLGPGLEEVVARGDTDDDDGQRSSQDVDAMSFLRKHQAKQQENIAKAHF